MKINHCESLDVFSINGFMHILKNTQSSSPIYSPHTVRAEIHAEFF